MYRAIHAILANLTYRKQYIDTHVDIYTITHFIIIPTPNLKRGPQRSSANRTRRSRTLKLTRTLTYSHTRVAREDLMTCNELFSCDYTIRPSVTQIVVQQSNSGDSRLIRSNLVNSLCVSEAHGSKHICSGISLVLVTQL